MPSATREIRRRIRSITSTRKVTKAMELVASAKMRRAVQAVLASRTYAQQAWEMITGLAERTHRELHPLLRRGRGSASAVVLITSNRGLVGGFNTQLLAAVTAAFGQGSEGRPNVVLLGRRGRPIVTKFGFPAAAEFEKQDLVTRVTQVRPLAKLIIDDFRAGRYDRIVLAYTDFVSTLVQRPRVRQLLPLERDPELGRVAGTGTEEADRVRPRAGREYLFEPNADEVLEAILPRLVEMQLYQAVVESNASEHAARMVAMRNASDAAGDLIDDLTLTYNQARQAAITQDLAEISASRATLGA